MNRTLLTLTLGLTACGPATETDAQARARIVDGMHGQLLTEIQALKSAAQQLKAAAPTPQGRGWDAQLDAAAITEMKAKWYLARTAYEHVEGAIAPLFPDIDAAIDERYDGFLEGLGVVGDQNLFDGQGVTGMHAIERILWSDTAPAGVVQLESTLPGYKAAAWPSSEAEARDFKELLCTQLIADVQRLESQWSPARIDLAGAFQGLKDLMNEQREKVNAASNDVEESRYSQRTMKDLRDNLTGSKQSYGLFQSWLQTKKSPVDAAHDGHQVDARIMAGFSSLEQAYAAVEGDSIPPPPSSWSAESPSAADLSTPFGKLYTAVRDATDPTKTGSMVDEMGDAAVLLGLSAGL